MKKLFFALIFCTAMLCGCSAKAGNEISETALPETSSVTVATESSAAVSEAETTAMITTTTAKRETTVTRLAEEEIILTPIPSNEPFEIMSCKIIEDIVADNEEVLKRAKEICFNDEEISEDIKRYNDNVDRGIFNPDYGEIKVETAEDIEFSNGVAFDFDNDGKDEYVLVLDSAPLDPMFGCCTIFIDGNNYEINARDCGITDLTIVSGGGYYFPMVTIDGVAGQTKFIYSFENNKIKDVLKPIGSGPYTTIFENGIFYLGYKYERTAEPFILCGDGVFRQLGREKITRDDFENHVRNGGAYLDSLAENGEEITEFYTYGYFNYELCGEDFHYGVYSPLFGDDKGKFLTERRDWLPKGEVRFTDEVVYGDLWAVQTTRSQDYDIGGGYTCYISENGKILNVVKDNIITDSMMMGAYNFLPDWQIKFYDMDVPPCFALKTSSWDIEYRTYFVIDGKITEMNWTLDGEKLDKIDYTMLQCRGERLSLYPYRHTVSKTENVPMDNDASVLLPAENNGEFVSYSIPVFKNDRFTKRHFTFAEGDYTNIVGYSKEIDGEIIKWWDTDSGTSCETANELMHKFCGFWDGAYRAETSYDGNERWLLLIEKEGFRTKEEMTNTLSEFCTPAAVEEVYSMLLENRYSDFELIDGRIYLHEGPPSNYLPCYFIESEEEKDGVITAKLFAYYSIQNIPYVICPPLYAEFVFEDGVWKISSLPKER